MKTRFNLFTLPHKGLRHALQSLVYQAGRLDSSCQLERDTFLKEWKKIVLMLHQHATDEDIFIQPLIDKFNPDLAKELENQHRQSEDLLGKMENAIAEIETEKTWTHESNLRWLTFLDDLNRFTGDYFLHLYHEECFAMPCLWSYLDDEALIVVGNKVRSGVPPHIQQTFQQYMIPAMNKHERLMMLSSVKQHAPQEVFEGVCRTVQELLSPVEWEVLHKEVSDLAC
ncbi:hemerythrin domain-containing protein [Brevibacillus sp. SYSU BS000544]|uniref:hemerythrin domain-containing protein n=1 Tax=Brevibacillus sp. SYSU BS000544 TaxID=3416443 RepID=UPI003CE52997